MQLLRIILILLMSAGTILRILPGLMTPITRWDEETNIAVVREMKANTSLYIPYYQGSPFFEKPPLWYTINTVIIPDKPHSPIVFRAVSVLSAMLIILLSVGFVWKRHGTVSGVITWGMLMLSNQLFIRNPADIFSSHTLTSADLDSLQILLILITVIASTKQHRYAQIAIGITTGLAVLTKGPLGFVPLLVLTFMRTPTRTSWIVAIIIMLPWYIGMISVFGKSFISSHIGYHLVARTITALEGHTNPPWYYLTILLNPLVYPVFPVTLYCLYTAIRSYRSLSPIYRYVCGICLAFFLLPTLLGTKLAWYILPIYPFLAMLTGMTLGPRIANRLS